jgi:hypothetical protein
VNRLPEPEARQPHATQAGQPTPDTLHQAAEIAAAVDAVYAQPTFYRDHTPVPAIGTAPPVAQEGRPPMSQWATDASAMMLSAGVASVPIGGMTSLVLYTLGHVDPTTLAIAAAAPATIALPILALCRLAGKAKQVVEAAPPVINQHFHGDVDQRTVNSTTRGLIASTRNQLPPGKG